MEKAKQNKDKVNHIEEIVITKKTTAFYMGADGKIHSKGFFLKGRKLKVNKAYYVFINNKKLYHVQDVRHPNIFIFCGSNIQRQNPATAYKPAVTKIPTVSDAMKQGASNADGLCEYADDAFLHDDGFNYYQNKEEIDFDKLPIAYEHDNSNTHHKHTHHHQKISGRAFGD